MAHDDDGDRLIPAHDLEMLQRACGVAIPEGMTFDQVEPPPKVVATYWKFKRAMDRIDAGELSPQSIATIVLLAGLGQKIKAVDEPPVLIPDLLERGEVKLGAVVTAQWRGKEVDGMLMGLTPDKRKVLVRFTGDAEVREIPPADVKVGEMVGA